MLGNYKILISSQKQFQQGMFFVFTLVTIMEVALPALVNFIIVGNKALGKVFIVATKTAVLTLSLQYFIANAYFVDTSRIFGTVTLFMFLVSFFLMQKTESAREFSTLIKS